MAIIGNIPYFQTHPFKRKNPGMNSYWKLRATQIYANKRKSDKIASNMKQPLCHMTCNQTYGSLQIISGHVLKDPNPSLNARRRRLGFSLSHEDIGNQGKSWRSLASLYKWINGPLIERAFWPVQRCSVAGKKSEQSTKKCHGGSQRDIATDKHLEHHLEKKSENRHSGDVLSMGFKKSS